MIITLICASFILISLSVLAMAIGYLVQKKAIAGSCGGLATISASKASGEKLICGNCGKDLSQIPEGSCPEPAHTK